MAQWRVRMSARAQAGCSLKAATGSSEHGRAMSERAVSLAQWAVVGHGPTPTSAARRAHAVSVRAAPPPEREQAQWRIRVCAHAQTDCSFEAAAGTSEHGIAPREAFRWCSGHPKGMDRLQPAQSGARVPQAHVLRLLLRESSRWRHRVFAHANTGYSSEAAADTSEHGRAPRERAVLVAQWASMGHGRTPASTARRARATSARAALSSVREHMVACSRVRTRERRLPLRRSRLARQSTTVHRGRGPSRWRSKLRTNASRLQPARHGALTPQAHVLRLLPRESERSGAIPCAHMRKQAARW